MGTISYFEREVQDAASDATASIECGTTGYAGKGPQLFIKFNEYSIILSHEDAAAFCSGVANVARYFNYPHVEM